MLLHEEWQAMDILPHTSHILCLHEHVTTGFGYKQYTRIQFIQATEALNLWDQIWWEEQNNDDILMLLYVVK